MRLSITSFFVFVCLLIAGLNVYGQSQLGTGAISGTVQDANGAVIAGATVTISNASTGFKRALQTNTAGQFNVPVLPPGEYAVRVEQTGFSILEQQNLIVNVGSTATLRLELQPGNIGEVVNVTTDQTIDTTKTEEATLINRAQINDLPINGRRPDQFALLAPGVTREGRFGLLSYRGQSGVFNNFTIEGNDDNQAYFSEARGRTRIASSYSANAVQEFQVVQSNFLPEFGRSAGGGINAVFRSGGNVLHGDGFYYFRNQKLSARDPLATIKPFERRQQFGGSFSGPVVKDKAFFFVNYDQQLRNFPLITQDLTGALSGNPSDPNFLAGCNDIIKRIAAIPGGAPNNSLVCGASNQFLTLVPRNANQNLFLAKIDYNVTQANALSFTYNYLNARSRNGIQTPLVLGNFGRNGSDNVRIDSFNARLTSTITSRAVNEFRFQFGRDLETEFGDQPPPQVFIGSFSFGRANFLERPALPNEHRLQFVDNFSYSIGRHALKFGAESNRALDNINNPANFGGTYTYPNTTAYGRDLLNPGQRNYTSYTQSFGLPGLKFKTIDYALFAQDQWRVFNRLTINYGLRYDYQDFPEPVSPNPTFAETQSFKSDRTNFGPRIGLAYDIKNDGKTVVRAGYGLYYGRTPNGTISDALTRTGILDPALNTIGINLQPTQAGAPVFPNVLTDIPTAAAGSTSLSLLDPNFRRPRLQEINAGVERQLARNLSVSASFIYTKGDRLPVTYDINLPAPAFSRTYQLPDGSTFSVPFSAGLTRTAAGVAQNLNASRPNPNFGPINEQRSIGETFYKALFVEVKRRFSNNFQFNLAYTLAKAENLSGSAGGDGSGSEGPFSGARLQNQFDPISNRAAATTDQRHRLVLNGIFNLPKIQTGSRLSRALVNGYRLSGIYTAESGRPFSAVISLPNIPFTVNGAQYNGFGGLFGQGSSNDQNLAPSIQRNSNYGQPNYRLDLRLARDIKLSERFTLELIGEGFNIFNRSNFNGFATTIYSAALPTGSSATNPPSLAAPIILNAPTNATPFGTPNNDGSQPDGTNARRFQLAARFRF